MQLYTYEISCRQMNELAQEYNAHPNNVDLKNNVSLKNSIRKQICKKTRSYISGMFSQKLNISVDQTTHSKYGVRVRAA